MGSLGLVSEVAARKCAMPSWAFWLGLMCLTATFAVPALGQESSGPEPSIVEAAQSAREQQSKSTAHPKVVTNDDLAPQLTQPSGLPSASASPQEASAQNTAEVATPEKAGCDNSDSERIKSELQDAEGEQNQLRSELSYQPKVISDNDVDMQNFKPGSSGINLGSPALSDSQPQAPARVDEVIVNQKIASLKEALTISCAPREDKEAERDLYSAQQRLSLLQQEIALDQAAYYSKPDYSSDAAGKTRIDAEQRQIESLQSEIERLKNELAESKTNQNVESTVD